MKKRRDVLPRPVKCALRMQPTRFLRTIKVHKKNVKKKLDGEENREMAA